MSRTQAKTKTMIITMNTTGTICLFWFCYFFLYNDVKLSFCISNQCMVHSLGEGCKLCRCQRGRLGLGWVGEKGVTRFLAAAINLGGNTPTHFALSFSPALSTPPISCQRLYSFLFLMGRIYCQLWRPITKNSLV